MVSFGFNHCEIAINLLSSFFVASTILKALMKFSPKVCKYFESAEVISMMRRYVMAVKTCWYRIILSNMTLASNRALTFNFSEVETQYRTSITLQNMPLEPSSNVPKKFLKTFVLRPPSSCSKSLIYFEYHDHVFGSSDLSTCPFANMIPERTLKPFELIQIEIWMHN